MQTEPSDGGTDRRTVAVIGICAARERARWSFWDQDAALVAGSYLQAVRRDGGLGLALAPEELHDGDAERLVDRIDDGGVVTARSVVDGLVEAIEWPAHRYVLGVQWHPEALELSRTIAAFVRTAARTAALGLAAGDRAA